MKIKQCSLNSFKEIALTAPPQSKRSWGRVVNYLYDNKCLITGLSADQAKLEKHHLYNVFDYPHLQLCVFNGVVITRDLHLMFHRLYGQKVTARDFLDFLKKVQPGFLKDYAEQVYAASVWVGELDRVIYNDYLNQNTVK